MSKVVNWLALPRRRGRVGKPDPPILRALGALAAAAAAGAGAAWAWAVHAASVPPELWVGEGWLKRCVLPRCTLLRLPYRPSPLALSPHAQNILGYVRGVALDTSACYTRQLVLTPDGGTLGLDWYHGSDGSSGSPPSSDPAGGHQPPRPVLLVLHGINGGSHESYCRAICHAAVTRRGWRAVVLNYRGCNGLPLTSPRGYAATLTPDVHVAVEAVRARLPPGTPLLTVGYSLGGILLTKYLAELCLGLHATPDGPSGNNVISAAAVVSSPICLANSGATLGRPWTPGYIYNLALAHKLREYISHHRGELSGAQSGVVSLDAALAQRTVGRMEDEGRLPAAFGFASRAAYHEAASSLPLIPAITSPPTLFLVSRDDPFLGVLPDAECAANPSTLLAATSHGGHVAFLRGWAPLSLELEASWMDDVVLQFLAAVMDARREAAEVDGVETRTGPVGCKPVEGLGAPDAHMTPNWNGDSAAVLTQEDGSHSSAHVPVGQLPRSAVTWLDLDEARLPWRGGEEGLRPPRAAPRSRL